MKKILLTIIALTSLNAFAQVKVKAGVNVPNIKNEYAFKNDRIDKVKKNNIGYFVGINYEYKITDTFSLEADLLYSSISYDSDKFLIKNEEFKTMSLPITLGYYPIQKLKIAAGLNFNYLLKAEMEPDMTDLSLLPSDVTGNKVTTDEYDKINYGIHAGASYNIYNNLFIDVRYNIGLGNMYKDEYKDEYKLSQNNLQLGLSYKF